MATLFRRYPRIRLASDDIRAQVAAKVPRGLGTHILHVTQISATLVPATLIKMNHLADGYYYTPGRSMTRP